MVEKDDLFCYLLVAKVATLGECVCVGGGVNSYRGSGTVWYICALRSKS